jgi:hypothetical protein
MMERNLITCDTPGCGEEIHLDVVGISIGEYIFCQKCKKEHSHHVLAIQVKHGKLIREIIDEAKIFKSANHMADFIGISFVTMYHWLQKYYGMTFQQFKRTYICKSESCYLLNIQRSSYSRDDYILRKIRDRRYCACINALEKDHIMTNAPLKILPFVLAGKPRIAEISDRVFTLIPTPVKFEHSVSPIYDQIG